MNIGEHTTGCTKTRATSRALRVPAHWLAIAMLAAFGCTNDGDGGETSNDLPTGVAPPDTSKPTDTSIQPPEATKPPIAPPESTSNQPSPPAKPPAPNVEPAVAAAALQLVSSCEEAEKSIRARALADMNARIDALKKQGRIGSCSPVAATPGAANGAPTAPPAMRDSASSSGANETSMTNNQVAGVDEADFVKNDSKYLYTVANGALRILQAWPANEAKTLSTVKLEGTPKKLFVTEDRALVYVSVPRTDAAADAAPSGGVPPSRYATQTECTYGYDCEFGGDGTATAVLVFDISDRGAPKQVRRIDLSGSLLAARRIGNAVHTVVVTPELTFPDVSYYPAGFNSCGEQLPPDQLEAAYETLRKKNAEIIEKADLGDFLPSIRENGVDYAADGCDSVYREGESSGVAYTTVVSLDIRESTPPSIATILSKPGPVYASAEALYIAVIRGAPVSLAGFGISRPAVPPMNDSAVELASAIHKFRIGEKPEATAYLASGLVKGHVLNQFSMDEHKEHLRVATSWGRVPSPDVHSTMSVLAQGEGGLGVVGEVDNIAPHEDIRSVRFDGDRGFIVTFKKTDPLYAFDLSSPKSPKITGELKIPGFSTYMHMLDEQHLLTIGYDAADQGDFAYFTGVLLQLFDVSDMANPKLAHKLSIGTRGTSSEALTNHLAFTLFQGKLAVPMTLCEGGDTNGQFGTNMTFSGLMVFDVSVADGIDERGRVAHPGPTGMYDDTGCSNWWTRANSVVQRSVFMDDFVYSIALDSVHVQNVKSLGKDVSSVSLTTAP